ncbi:MAG: NTP transferase domain-containing protein [Deinococcus sp.]|nr:NTP transferase domain-containing protein [Deinococcus sp.]
MKAIVLAGGSLEDPFAKRFGVATKALVPFRGRPQVEYALEALASNGLETIFIGPEAELNPAPKTCLPDQGSMIANLEAALNAVGPAGGREMVVVTSGDMPLITEKAVRFVIENAPRAALVYSIVRKEEIEKNFPGMRRTYARLREGSFTGGNITLLDPWLFLPALPLAKKAIALRKNPLALARLIGLDVLLGLLLGKVALAGLEARVSKILRIPARALVVPYPEVGIDMDSEEDLAWLQKRLPTKEP